MEKLLRTIFYKIIMEKKLIPFDKIIFMDPEDKQYNIPKVSNKEKKSFYFDLKSKGFIMGV